MPELPEVETIRRQLAERLPGRRIASVRIEDPLLTAPEPPAELEARLAGRVITALGRRGKHLLVDIASGDSLVVHLRMTGGLRWRPGPEAGEREPYTRARVGLDDGAALALWDRRRLGRAWIVPAGVDRERYWAARVGVEPLSPRFTARALGAMLARRRAPVKACLLHQGLVAGLGNMYVDEALFQARVHPERAGGAVTAPETRRLHRAIRDRLEAGIAAGGASIDTYRDALGGRGAMQGLLRVHLHAGEPCPRCGTTILKTRVAQRGTYHCPRCQEAPW